MHKETKVRWWHKGSTFCAKIVSFARYCFPKNAYCLFVVTFLISWRPDVQLKGKMTPILTSHKNSPIQPRFKFQAKRLQDQCHVLCYCCAQHFFCFDVVMPGWVCAFLTDVVLSDCVSFQSGGRWHWCNVGPALFVSKLLETTSDTLYTQVQMHLDKGP